MTIRERARRGLLIYFSVVLLVSAALEGWIIAHGGLGGPAGWLVLPLMYTPGMASIVARLAGREGFGDVSFRWGGGVGTQASLTAWLIPLAIGFVAYGMAWATGLADFKAPADGPLASITNPAARFAASIPIALTVGTVLSCLSAFGEELGWRGYGVRPVPERAGRHRVGRGVRRYHCGDGLAGLFHHSAGALGRHHTR